MICFDYEVKDSLIVGAGKGLFARTNLPPGKVLIAPDQINDVCSVSEIETDARAAASVRWFEDQCSIAEHWPDECFVNHSYSANGLWHLGFTFSLRPIQRGEEITMDYSHLLAEGVESFIDSATGRVLRGLPWSEALRLQTHLLRQALEFNKWEVIAERT